MKDRWERLFEFVDKEEFTIEDFLKCICATLNIIEQEKFEATIIAHKTWNIQIQEKKQN